MRRILLATVIVAMLAMLALFGATGAMASRTADSLTCGDASYALTVTSTSNDHSLSWGVGTISGGTHLIPTSFSGSGVDATTGETLFSFTQLKGNANGQHNQTQTSCDGPTDTVTAGDLGGIPGIADSDLIQITFSVTAVFKP
ncbi:MAG: hypothetical protein ACRDM1_15075 [Gaiellaceae bacterium]